MRPIYLDYNATTPIAPRVQEAMLPFLAEHFGNPLSDHVLGRAAAQAIEDARYRVAKAIGAEADEVYFTTSASESCQEATRKGSLKWRDGSPFHVPTVISTVNHRCERYAFKKEKHISCGSSGVIRLDDIEELCQHSATLFSIVHANHEIGALQPIRQFASCCRQSSAKHGRSVRLHSDAAQSFGKTRIDVDELGVDMLTISSHKAYGPKGTAALFARGIEFGRANDNGFTLSPGMPDIAAIVGFGYAAELAAASVEESAPRMASLRDRLLEQLQDGVGDDLIVWGEGAERLPNTLAVAFPDVVGEELLRACPEICATPLASRSGERIKLSSTLRAIKADREQAAGSIRLSVGWYTDQEEIDRAASLLIDAWERLRGSR